MFCRIFAYLIYLLHLIYTYKLHMCTYLFKNIKLRESLVYLASYTLIKLLFKGYLSKTIFHIMFSFKFLFILQSIIKYFLHLHMPYSFKFNFVNSYCKDILSILIKKKTFFEICLWILQRLTNLLLMLRQLKKVYIKY